MGKPVKRANGVWGVQFKVAGVRESGTFATRREAEDWQARRKLELKAISRGRGGDVKTLQNALTKYRDEVSPTHKGGAWEVRRIDAMLRHPALPKMLALSRVQPEQLQAWRDARSSAVSAGSVLRDMTLLSSVFSHAMREWRWISSNPLSEVRRPPQPKHRERIITRSEVKIMLRALGYHPGKPPRTLMAQVGCAFVLALRTGMRAGEIEGLTWDRVHPKYVTLSSTKNGDARDVPMPKQARKLLELMRGFDPERVFLVASGTRDTIFRRARERSGLSGFTFHDARHAAATRIGATVGQPGRLSFPQFCRVMGWRDPKYALIYVNTRAADLADLM